MSLCCHTFFFKGMLLYYFKIEETVLRLNRNKKKTGREGGVQNSNPLISEVCLLFNGGEGWGGFVEDDTEKKIHQLRI